MFSRIYDQATAAKTGAAGKKPALRGGRKEQKDKDLIPDFDATTHVIRSLTDLLATARFRSPLERQQFAREITSYARDLALRLRRDLNRERAMAVSTRRVGSSSRPAEETGVPARNAKMMSQLRTGIRRLDQEIGKLDAAMKALNPVAINPSRLPRPEALEVLLLEDAIEKIARQIDEAEKKITTLLSGRPPSAV
jgi:hypothetical protein